MNTGVSASTGGVRVEANLTNLGDEKILDEILIHLPEINLSLKETDEYEYSDISLSVEQIRSLYNALGMILNSIDNGYI